MFFLRSMVAKLVFWSVVLLLLVGYTGQSLALEQPECRQSERFHLLAGPVQDIAAQLANSDEVRQAALDAPD